VIGPGRTLEDAARSTPVHFFVIVSARDHLVNPEPALDWANSISAPTYVSTGDCAHLIMTCDAEGVSSRVRPFLLTGKVP
jgi:homoserine O-acetyltransferase/O-succinyltransferase